MGNRILFFVPCFILVACTAKLTPVPAASSIKMDAEEPAVYAAVLNEFAPASDYVLMDTTTLDLSGEQDVNSTLDRVLTNMHDVSAQTVDNFRLRNDTPYPLQADMEIGTDYILLSQSVMRQIFSQNQDGWQLFYQQYPDAPGIASLSRVGFNQRLDQALVYIGIQRNWLAGGGYYVLLTKENGKWVIDQQVMIWIS